MTVAALVPFPRTIDDVNLIQPSIIDTVRAAAQV